MKLIFATYNAHKLQEVQQMLPDFHLNSLSDIGFDQEIEETGNTFKANAEIKVDAIGQVTNISIFADDSGLVIPSLNGEPGIYSSRYAGTGKSEDNIQKVLHQLDGHTDRSAFFIAVICLLFNHKKYYFEGKIEGTILEEISGAGGFGYDPIFQPNGYNISFAELAPEEKNAISHRGNAIKKMAKFLKENCTT